MKKYLLITEDNVGTINQEMFSSMDAATTEGVKLYELNKIKKFVVNPFKIQLSDSEIRNLYQEKVEKYDIFEDVLYILENENGFNSQDIAEDLKQDIDVIFWSYNKVYDSELSYWDNIRNTIQHLKDVAATRFNYNNMKGGE